MAVPLNSLFQEVKSHERTGKSEYQMYRTAVQTSRSGSELLLSA